MYALVKIDDLADNPTARVPVCLCLDTSGSMSGAPINELNDGVRLFYEAIREDEMALYSAEISIVTFGGGGATCVCDFAGLEIQPNAPTLQASGATPMGEAINLGLDLLERRKSEYKEKGVDYYQPWLVLMTDGVPTSSQEELWRAVNRVLELENQNKLTIFPIGIGAEVNMEILAGFSTKRTPLKLQGLKFREFFAWLSQSVSRTSQSTPRESITLDVEAIQGWGTL
ncbi:VWA domain-containing protein [Helicobacter sp. 16-1353]|uniref:vWA domain-containing protein n=1 Tax=Helicobacter sp. 16-1353 TaxID=2004996 RepID=UPI001C657C10|nr:VWA domain-containing protein [Helicobacter sp. 16-1353]